MKPERIWWWSTRLHRAGWTPAARLLKTINYVVFRAILPYECEVAPDVRLLHRGLNVVVHPRTRIGNGVKLGHSVTITGGRQAPGSDLGVIVEDNVFIGVGAVIVPRAGRSLTLGAGCRVGANATVIEDVPAGATVVAPAGVLV